MQQAAQQLNPSRKRAREDFIVSDNIADQLFDANSIRKPSAPSKYVKVSKEVEKDPTRIAARLKQIAFGKNTVGYDNYVVAVPKEKRGGYQEHPRTPDAYEAQSKRAFDGKVKAWRRGIHHWDTLDGATGDMDAGKVTSSPMKVEAQEAGASGAASSPGGVSALLLSGAKCTDSVPAPTFYTAEQVLQLASANDDELADYSEDEEDVL